MKKRTSNLLYLILTAVVLGTGCKKENDNPPAIQAPMGSAYVTNEGSFMNQNASVTLISPNSVVAEDPYFDRNGVTLGDVCTGLWIGGDEGYAVLNNSQRVVVFNSTTFEHKGVIEGFSYPRQIIGIGNGMACVSDGSFAGQIHLINLGTRTIVQSVAVGNGPEQMVVSGGYLFVVNTGGWATDHTVTAINLSTFQAESTIDVGDRPVNLVADGVGNVWVLCAGHVIYDSGWNITGHTAAELYRIDAATLTVTWSETVGVLGDHPDDLAISPDRQTLYINLGGVRQLSVSNPELPGTLFIPGSFHTMHTHPGDGSIWLTSIPDYISNSSVYRYSSTGQSNGTFVAGIGSNGVHWK